MYAGIWTISPLLQLFNVFLFFCIHFLGSKPRTARGLGLSSRGCVFGAGTVAGMIADVLLYVLLYTVDLEGAHSGAITWEAGSASVRH